MRYLPPLPEKYKAAVLGGMLLLGLVATFAVFGDRGIVHLGRLRSQQQAAEEIAANLASENQRLRDHLHRLEHDDAYLEKIARESLGWIRPGEIVYHVSSMKETSLPATEPDADQPDTEDIARSAP